MPEVTYRDFRDLYLGIRQGPQPAPQAKTAVAAKAKPRPEPQPEPRPEESVPDFATRVLGLDLDPKQLALLSATASHVILNCSRQWGKSTMAAAKAVHQAIHRPGSLSIVVSPSERQSGELVEVIRKNFVTAGERVKGDGRNRASVVLDNGSRVVGLPATESTTRGFSNVSLLIADEASRMDDKLYYSFRPMLARSGGDIWLLSTPNGCQGFFYKTWISAEAGWFRLQATAEECSRISQKQLELDRREFSDGFFAQEYLCEFADADTALFRHAKLLALFDDRILDFTIP